MKKLLLASTLFLIPFLMGCSKALYVGETRSETDIYQRANPGSPVLYTIPAGYPLIVERKRNHFRKVVFDEYSGFAYKPSVKLTKKYKPKKTGDIFSAYRVKKEHNIDEDDDTESYRGSPSRNPSYNGGPVRVKGYFRKDGTYVRPHTRSAPKSGSHYKSGSYKSGSYKGGSYRGGSRGGRR